MTPTPEPKASLPNGLRLIVAIYLVLMVLGVVQGVRELLGLVAELRGLVGGDGFESLNFGASAVAGGTGVALWKGLRDGKPSAWKSVRRISFLAAPLFALGAVLVLVVDPSTVTISGPTGEIEGLEHPGRAAVIMAGITAFWVWQAWMLGRDEVRAHFFGTSEPSTAPPPA